MKYGETLRQRSIPAWSHYNIDYDDIKQLIKERTTPGKGKTISVPGRGDDKLAELEVTLFDILSDQHTRIDLFVRSKAGEIQRRLDHANKQLKQLSSRRVSAADRRIPIGRLERYGKLENDVLKAGDEIRSLARFTGIQRTAFRKLLKKYKKWTGSTELENRFREEVLDDPKSFTKLDLGPLLDEYSDTLQSIRTLYETKVQQVVPRKDSQQAAVPSTPSIIDQLQTALGNGSPVEFDTAIATIPLGDGGSLANYFVHPDNVVELQIFMLQYMEYFSSRSRSNSRDTSLPPLGHTGSIDSQQSEEADYFMLVADDIERFAHAQSAVTVSDRERLPGMSPQMAKAFVRRNKDEHSLLSIRSSPSKVRSVRLKNKYVDSFFDRDTPLPRKSDVTFADVNESLAEVRKEILNDPRLRPLYKISSCRSRFAGIKNNANSLTLATLDTSISMRKAGKGSESEEASDFPFAVLQIRKEGSAAADIITTLDKHHLVERVRGFSLQYHALWQTHKPQNISPPFWMPILSRDIRKLPPPALKANGSLGNSASGSQSATHRSTSTNSVPGTTEGTTAVETERPSSTNPTEVLETPPLRSFRKKRRRTYANIATETQPRYWSEYDHPEDGEAGENGYIIYIDPNERSTLDRLLERLGGLRNVFSPRKPEEESLLPSPGTPNEEESSDDEVATPHRVASYGTVTPHFIARAKSNDQRLLYLPQVTSICLVAAAAILIVAYILAETSGHKHATEASAGILFAIACSLFFAVIGFIPLWNRRDITWPSIGVAALVLGLDVMFSGFLLAQILG